MSDGPIFGDYYPGACAVCPSRPLSFVLERGMCVSPRTHGDAVHLPTSRSERDVNLLLGPTECYPSHDHGEGSTNRSTECLCGCVSTTGSRSASPFAASKSC